ncbi:hypothetical protein RMATCC62417_04273 [Rhizopus microsporus]|nr:hypothetical protein RMATCC62417_04273 [Rhizopus microsporus]
MLKKNSNNKTIHIQLLEEKFYFPGETIKGNVVVHPNSPTKVNWIQLKFNGKVCLHLKEKEIIPLFEDIKSIHTSKQKITTLDASEHTFPFEFQIPNHLNLPSSMQFGKKCYIRYTISALLHRPMIPESLCPKTEYHISILEHIDIQQSQFTVPYEKIQHVIIAKDKRSIVKAFIPRIGFTRGDIIPLQVNIHHFTSFQRKKCIKVELIRTLEIRTIRHSVTKETVLKSTDYDINIDFALQQLLNCQVLVPTSTPPSIRYKDKLLRFHYKIKLSISYTDKVNCSIDLPIVIGTWPRASIPIDDEEEDDDLSSLDIESLRTIEGIRNSVISDIERSNSVKSYNSISSWNSWENRTAITTLSSPASLSQHSLTSNNNSINYSTYHHNIHNDNNNYNNYSMYNNNINNRYSMPRFVEEVPTHVLTPIITPPPSLSHSQQSEQPYGSSSSTDDSDEEDDLLSIIKKKKKKEQKELRKKMNQLQVN